MVFFIFYFLFFAVFIINIVLRTPPLGPIPDGIDFYFYSIS